MTDEWTDGQGDSYIPPNFVCGGYNKKNILPPLLETGEIKNIFYFPY
jgi:hypothetical protein